MWCFDLTDCQLKITFCGNNHPLFSFVKFIILPADVAIFPAIFLSRSRFFFLKLSIVGPQSNLGSHMTWYITLEVPERYQET